MHQNTHISASCTRKYTRVPTPVSCCPAMRYPTLTLLPPPPPPRSPPGACAVAYAACARKMQNQDFSFDPPRTPLSYTPLSFAAGGAGRGANLKCNVCQNYLPGDQALWQAVGGSVEGGDSTCADAIFVRGGFCQHAYVYGCARVQRADKAMCVCVITYAAPPSPLYPPHACQMSCSTAQRK